jgi:multicomponent Na+:H+ antiporter subunit C
MAHLEYLLAIVLFVIGLHGVLTRTHLVEKLLAMNLLQVAVIVFFIAAAAQRDAGPPIASAASLAPGAAPAVAEHVNPLPHALMLTAIVVGVSTTGLALALLIRIEDRYGTLEEQQLLERMR